MKRMSAPINKEAVRLYRDILRGCKQFHWCNSNGEQWSRILRKSAREEFEQARGERDPLVQARLLVVGRQCLNQTLYKYDKTNLKITEKIDNSRNRGSL